MPTAVITGSGGLVGSESVRHFVEICYDVVGLESDLRASLFGPEASTAPTTAELVHRYKEFRSLDVDIRDSDRVLAVFSKHARELEIVIHTAAQPSHDWAASDPQTDFAVNATGTLNVLEAARRCQPDATFVFTSTNKVYGDAPNYLPLVELETRLELPEDHRYYRGIDTSMPLDRSMHSLFGVSKAAADLLVQEYGRYFQMPTVCFRGGCLTGPNHAGTQLHGFLSYLVRCTVTGQRYTVFGYRGRQVRDNIHSRDLVRAIAEFHRRPGTSAVYNIGGGRHANCSMIEAIQLCEEVVGRALNWELSDQERKGDHRWWISDLGEFEADYPEWTLEYDIERIIREIYEQNVESWTAGRLHPP